MAYIDLYKTYKYNITNYIHIYSYYNSYYRNLGEYAIHKNYINKLHKQYVRHVWKTHYELCNSYRKVLTIDINII